MQLTEQKILDMPTGALAVLFMVESGVNPRKKFSKVTYYKHRMILRALGVDIQPRVDEISGKAKSK